MNLFWKCAVVVTASIVQSLGLTLQRLSHLEPLASHYTEQAWTDGATNNESVPLLPKRRTVILWRLGIVLFISANIFGSTVQLAVLPLVLVCTLQAIGLVSNSVLAHIILHEPLTRKAVLGTLLVVLGAVVVAGLSGSKSEPKVPLNALLHMLISPKFIAWLLTTVFIMAICYLYSRRLTHQQTRGDPVDVIKFGWLWGILGGVLSAHSLLMAKLCIGIIIQDFPDALLELLKPGFWIITALFLTFAITQMWCVNRGLEYVSTSVLYPLIFCVYNTTTLINSVMLYGVYAVFEGGHVAGVIAGTGVLISGVMLLSTRFSQQQSNAAATATATAAPERSPTQTVHQEWTPFSTNQATASPRPQKRTLALPFLSGLQAPTLLPTSQPASPRLRSPLSPMPEANPLDQGPSYTSFDSISPNITSPDKVRGRPGHRVLSKEQHKILRELGV